MTGGHGIVLLGIIEIFNIINLKSLISDITTPEPISVISISTFIGQLFIIASLYYKKSLKLLFGMGLFCLYIGVSILIATTVENIGTITAIPFLIVSFFTVYKIYIKKVNI